MSFVSDGARFVPKAKGSQWEEIRAKTGGLQKRILMCPPGHVLRRYEDVPELDDCQRCENGFYLIESSFWEGPNATLKECRRCPSEADCRGADRMEAHAGFWRLQFQYTDGYEYLMDAGCGTRLSEGQVCLFPDGAFHTVLDISPHACTSELVP